MTTQTEHSDDQWLDPDALRELQVRKLQSALDYVLKRSPYYQRVLKEFNLSENRITQLEEFQGLPFTGKEDLQKYNDDFLCVPRHQVQDYCSTSGTLGEPVHILLTSADLDRLALNEQLGMEIAGITTEDVIQLTTTIDRRFMAGLAYLSGARRLGAGMIRNGSGFPAMQWDTIRRFNPTVLIGVPSFIVKMLDFAKSEGISWKSSSIRKILCIGESLRSDENGLSAAAGRILEEWDVQLAGTYASTEMQTCFTECPHGKGGHLLPSLVYPEIIDEHGQPVPEGGTGELVITTLGVEGMPLIRYRTGDMCSMTTRPCSCGRTTPRLLQVTGRKLQMLKVKGTTIYPSMIFNVLESTHGVLNYLVEATLDDLGHDQVRIYLSTKDSSADLLNNIMNHLAGTLRLKPDLQVVDDPWILNIQLGAGNRKPVRFIDKRNIKTK